MHPNSLFRKEADSDSLARAEERGFGVLTVQLDTLFGAHVPFYLDGDRACLHLVRSNPVAKASRQGPQRALIVVSLCDAYVSPDWYGAEDQVPTWNYGAVNLHGTIKALPDSQLEPVLAELSARFEARLAPKPAWTMEKMSKKAKTSMMRAIQPFELLIDRVEATDKFSQNKPLQVMETMVPQLEAQSFGHEVGQVAERVRAHMELKKP